MKLNLVLGLAIGFSALGATAGSVNFDFRGDMMSQTANEEAAKARYGQDHVKFFINSARIDFKGNLNTELSFRARIKLTESIATKNQRDNMTNLADLAFLNYKFSDNFKMTLGKLATEIGGIEGQTAAPEMFMTSGVYNSLGVERYASGVKLTANCTNAEMSLMSVNQSADAPAGATSGTFEQNRMLTGALVKAKFTPVFQPQLGYYWVSNQNSTPYRRDDFYNAGFRSQLSSYFFEYDYLKNDQTDKTIKTQTDSLESHVASLGAVFGRWTPKLKFESTKEFLSTVAIPRGSVSRYYGYQVAIEYRPAGEGNFTYHAAYFQKEKSPQSGGKQVLEVALVGARLNADFLK